MFLFDFTAASLRIQFIRALSLLTPPLKGKGEVSQYITLIKNCCLPMDSLLSSCVSGMEKLYSRNRIQEHGRNLEIIQFGFIISS